MPGASSGAEHCDHTLHRSARMDFWISPLNSTRSPKSVFEMGAGDLFCRAAKVPDRAAVFENFGPADILREVPDRADVLHSLLTMT